MEALKAKKAAMGKPVQAAAVGIALAASQLAGKLIGEEDGNGTDRSPEPDGSSDGEAG